MRYGRFSIQHLDGSYTGRFLGAKGGILVASSSGSIFEDQQNGLIKAVRSHSYLSLDQSSQLTLTEHPRPGISLEQMLGRDYEAKLAYRKSKIFYLCDDERLEWAVLCEGAQKVFILFVDIFQ